MSFDCNIELNPYNDDISIIPIPLTSNIPIVILGDVPIRVPSISLISDDAVDIKEIDGELIGSSPKVTQGMLEVRGIGIIDVSALYGLSSIVPEKSITFTMHFEHWKDDGDYDRLGNSNETMDILGVNIRKLTVPVRPGRNIAVLVEAAAANYRYSLMSNTSPIEIIGNRMDDVNRAN